MGKLISAKKLVNNYLGEKDWRTKENSNAGKSFGSMNKYVLGEVSKNYWLNEVYPKRIKKAYLSGDIHIHDLGALTLYCSGYSLESILVTGVTGISNIPRSAPAKHFYSALNQVTNLTTIFQNEQAGAVAFNNVDTLLAPFIRFDNLTEKEVKQAIQNFIFSLNSNSRMGSEPAFSNVTIDLTPPKAMLNKPIIIGGQMKLKENGDAYVYGEFQKEIDIFNKCFMEIMIEGDSDGKGFAYPIPTFNIGKRFDWDNPNSDLVFEMAGRFGYPYFANFINSDIDEDSIRSMCCRLKLDIMEIRRKVGGLFSNGDSTGSIGVVTINLPIIGYKAHSKRAFYKQLDKMLELSKESLELKREFLQKEILEKGLIPAFQTYVGKFDSYFSTIGIVGMNECCENFIGEDITTDAGKYFALEVEDYILERLKEFQVDTGNLYNLEQSPAESTAFRLAMKNKKKYPKIITRGDMGTPYYTNSSHVPVIEQMTFKEVLDNQEELQIKYTGGTALHLYTNKSISGSQAKQIIKTTFENYKIPYVSISPITRYCETHGFIDADVDVCPYCDSELDKYTRVTGYIRKVENFNEGKKKEFEERKLWTIS